MGARSAENMVALHTEETFITKSVSSVMKFKVHSGSCALVMILQKEDLS